MGNQMQPRECIRMLGRVLSIRLVARSSKSYPLSLTFLRSVSRVQDEENVEDDGDDGDDDGDGDDDDLLEERRSRGGNAALKIDKRLRVESTSQGLFGIRAPEILAGAPGDLETPTPEDPRA